MIADICKFILPFYILFVFIELAHSFYVFCWIVFLMFSSTSLKVNCDISIFLVFVLSFFIRGIIYVLFWYIVLWVLTDIVTSPSLPPPPWYKTVSSHLKCPCAPYGRLLFTSPAFRITELFSVSILLPFPEYYINGILQSLSGFFHLAYRIWHLF